MAESSLVTPKQFRVFSSLSAKLVLLFFFLCFFSVFTQLSLSSVKNEVVSFMDNLYYKNKDPQLRFKNKQQTK